MLTFHILSIFPKVVEEYTNESILNKAKSKNLVDFKFYDIRKYTDSKHGKVDDKPYGGGPGMLMNLQPILSCIDEIKNKLEKNGVKKNKIKTILFKPIGKIFSNDIARNYSKKFTDIILICGRYEGIDSRIEKILKPEIISVGDFVLTGGEIPAMIIIDSVSRQIKGVLGDENSLENLRNERDEFYTRPEVFIYKKKKYKVPDVLLSGNHKEIEKWKKSGIINS